MRWQNDSGDTALTPATLRDCKSTIYPPHQRQPVAMVGTGEWGKISLRLFKKRWKRSALKPLSSFRPLTPIFHCSHF